MHAKKRYSYNGFKGSLREWSERLGVPASTLDGRIRKYGLSRDALPHVFTAKSQKGLRRAHMYTFDGKTMTTAEWADYAGIKRSAFASRLRHGYTIEEAIRKEPKVAPKDKKRLFGGTRIEVDGIVDNIMGHCRRHGMCYATVCRRRLKMGMSLEEALKTPVGKPLVAPTTALLTFSFTPHRPTLRIAPPSLAFMTAQKDPAPKPRNRQRKMTVDGRTMCICDWCREYNVSEAMVRSRLRRGMSLKDALSRPYIAYSERKHKSAFTLLCEEHGIRPETVRRRMRCGVAEEHLFDKEPIYVKPRSGGNNYMSKMVEVDGERVTRTEAARRLGISVSAMTMREKMGWSVDEMTSVPKVEAKDRPARQWAAMRRRELAGMGLLV